MASEMSAQRQIRPGNTEGYTEGPTAGRIKDLTLAHLLRLSVPLTQL